MRCVDSKLSALFALGLTACSLVVDFPPLPHDASVTPKRDSSVPSRDAATDAGARPSDAGPSLACNVANNDNCDTSQLCCDRMDGKGPVCVDTSGGECSACGAACADDKAPNCGARKCECEAGSGQPCAAGQRCVGVGAAARCVQCMADLDCAARTDGKQQCVNNVCAECDRGALVNDNSDDQGCTPTKPICNSNNVCTACSVSPNNCGGMMQCDPVVGCTGCTSGVPVGQNGCGGTSPVCAPVTVSGKAALQCRKCTGDNECSGGYCIEQTGECVAACDPDKLPGANHCSNAAQPVCKLSASGYSCSSCSVAADCAGVTGATHCATQGALGGQCVACRNNTDCNRSPGTPVCSTSGTCRARDAGDCTGFTPRLEPNSKTCVECLPASQDVDCALSLVGPVCTSKFTCGECNSDAQCTTAGAPVCNMATNRCTKGCTMDAQCAGQSGTPHCDTTSGVCVGCTDHAQCTAPSASICSPTSKTCVACNAVTPIGTADRQCADARKGTACITNGPRAGSCGACDASMNMTRAGCGAPTPECSADTNTCVTCIDSPTGDRGCGAPIPYCITISGGSNPVVGCARCDPGTNAGCTGQEICMAAGGVYQCVAPVSDAGVGDAGP